MVQKKETKPRGRPRAYDSAVVLNAVLNTFWEKGYAATSVDDLCRATGLNKPSLYAAWGDKHGLYLHALDAYMARVGQGMAAALADVSGGVRPALDRVLGQAVSLYQSGRGCFLVTTAPAVAWDDEVVRQRVQQALLAQDHLLAQAFERAEQAGQRRLGPPVAMGAAVSAILHSLAVRARAGASTDALQAWASAALDALLGRESLSR
ncbi:MAG: TetR/AcrR family transcriptional regulator [Burkholderiales bacterium]|nr:TetR/AcrR family transcriptional regulator [Burkholderiales bacterium]